MAYIVDVLFNVMMFAILARVLMSWLPGAQNTKIGRLLFEFTEPVLAPIRRILPQMGMIDLSPLVALIALQVIAQIVVSGLSSM